MIILKNTVYNKAEYFMETLYQQTELPMYVTAIKNSAENGEIEAQYNLGMLYAAGKGVSQTYSLAAQWFSMAAQQGHTYAQCMLGLMYDYGLGVMQDVVLADTWFRIAAGLGSFAAKTALSVIEKTMGKEQLDAAGIFSDIWLERHNTMKK